jgi:hypothetical protein
MQSLKNTVIAKAYSKPITQPALYSNHGKISEKAPLPPLAGEREKEIERERERERERKRRFLSHTLSCFPFLFSRFPNMKTMQKKKSSLQLGLNSCNSGDR